MGAIVSTLGRVGLTMVTSLLTERFLKKFTIRIAEAVVKKTKSNADDKVVQDIKQEWGID